MKNQPGNMKNQPGTMKNHENRLGTMNNQPGTMNTHENRPGTINKQKRYKQTDTQKLPIIYRFPLKKHIHVNKHPRKTVFKTGDPFPQAKKQKTGIQINAQAQEIQKVIKETSNE